MSVPSTSTTEPAPRLVAVVPGVQVSLAGELQVEGRWLGTIGAVPDAVLGAVGSPEPRWLAGAALPLPGETPPGMVLTESLAAGPHWFAEQVVVAGQCVVLRLRPRPGRWRRWWSARYGQPVAQELALAARWRGSSHRVFPWGVLECGADPALRGAAVITLRTAALPELLPPAAPVFWRRRTKGECRELVASASSAARAAGGWSWGSGGVVFADGASIPSNPGTLDPAEWLPPDFVWQEGLGGAWRVRGERAGWRFTLGYTETGGRPVLCWLLARLDVADAGPWDPLLEAELHHAHQRWLRAVPGTPGRVAGGDTAPVVRAVAVNDSVARTGAELLLEWRAP